MAPIGLRFARAIAAACATIALTTDLHAQNPEALPTPPSSAEFMSRFDFYMSAAGLSDPDRRFSWDTHWGGDFDFWDYVRGRMSFLADYQVVLGDEYRLFDPNQGNYNLEGSLSFRYKGSEFAIVFHHLSRHLSDRANKKAIAMNVTEARFLRLFQLGRQTLSVRAEGGPVTARVFLDYQARALVEATLRRQLTPRTGLYGRLYGDYYAVDPEVAGRGDQNGGRIEVGFRMTGKGGKFDVFGGYEKVVDAYPLERRPRSWAFAGFRLVN